MTQAAAATSGAETAKTRTAKATKQGTASPEAILARKLAAARRLRGTVRFFESRRSLLSARERGTEARRALSRASRRLARVTKEAAYYRRIVARRHARRLAGAPPRIAIRVVFGRYAAQALAVARCESRLATTARNGQYLGLFQMGSYERQLFGHGQTAHAQALAAHRYFVRSGRDWSPWSCRWAAS